MKLENKTVKEKANIKADKIVKLNFKGVYNKDGYKIKVHSINKFDGGIEIFAQSWKDNKQLGFGKDGSIDIERFLFHNPRVLVDDKNGDIVKEFYSEVVGKTIYKKRKIDFIEATKLCLLDTVKIVGKENTDIVKNKIGNTTSTFYPDPDPESNGVDGYVRNTGEANWADAHDAANGTYVGAGNDLLVMRADTNHHIYRTYIVFDTSALPDTDTIDSAVLSIYGDNADFADADSTDIGVHAVTTASSTSLAVGDYNKTNFGANEFAVMDASTWDQAGYNDWTLDANGRANVSKTGASKFGVRCGRDIDDAAPSAGNTIILGESADSQAGTTKDPKLVVVHTVGVTTANVVPQLTIMGVG